MKIRRLRISADGFMDLSDRRRVRTPGAFVSDVEPAPEAEALSFLLSHSFPGHRQVVRALTLADRKKIQMALWADSVAERMTLVDRVWRNVSVPVAPPRDASVPELVQLVHSESGWVFPLYLDGEVTRVMPPGGVPAGELPMQQADVLPKTA